MNSLGYLCLILIIIACFAGLALAFAALRTGRRNFERGAVGAVYAVAALAVVASITLLVLLLTKDFSNDYVASHTSRSLPFAYTVSAFWAGNAGSLLLWLLLRDTRRHQQARLRQFDRLLDAGPEGRDG